MTLAIDRGEISRFVHALFPNLDPMGYVSLRAFRQFPLKGERDRPLHIEPIRLNLGLEPIINAAFRIAERVSNGGEAAVFAPPVCTFTGRKGARGSDVHEAPALSVEIDKGDLQRITDSLTLILGARPTIVLHSGSFWTDPDSGELLRKGHLHWRLRQAARGPEQQRMLRRARDIATLIAGGDPSSTPQVHPLRWPGSWNRKADPPVMATIIEESATAIDLTEALASLEDAAHASGLGVPRNAPHLANSDTTPVEVTQIADWLSHYPTEGLHWLDWAKVGMAVERLTGGSEAGFEVFRGWSATSPYYDLAGCRVRWEEIKGCPATWIGARFLRSKAIEHGWTEPVDDKVDQISPPQEPPLQPELEGSTDIKQEQAPSDQPPGEPDAPPDDEPPPKPEVEVGPNSTEPPPLTDDAAQAEIKRLASLPLLQYARERIGASRRLHIPVGFLDKLVELERSGGTASPAPSLPLSGSPPDSPEVTRLIAEFNSKYFVLNENGKAIIYAPKHDLILNRQFFERLTFADLDRLYSNRSVKVGEKNGEPVFRLVADVWLHHRKRKQFIGGVVFDPSTRKYDSDILNLWRGFTVKLQPGSWDLLKNHILNVICRRDNGLFNYLLDWKADLVQQPGTQGEVCVVLCGAEGSGKGVLARAIKYLLGQHGLAISNSKHLTGNFNAHLRDVVFLFADEAFYAGDKAHVGVLKSLITEPYLTIEGKYQNAVQVPNFLHIMMASNETWVVPASLRSRRWLVLDVDASRANDHAYFGAIQWELEHGGYEAMLHELLERPPFGNLRKIPVTDALQIQRKLSLGTTEGWWLDCLHRGYVFRSKLGLENYFGQWHEVIATDLLVDSYGEFCRAHHEWHPLSRELLGGWLRTMGYKPVYPRDVVVGEHIGEVFAPDGHSQRGPELVKRDRAYGYHLGRLDAARQAFIKTTGLAVEWAR